MNAVEALRESEKQATAAAKKRAEESKARLIREKKSRREKRAKYFQELTERAETSIKYAVERGDKDTQIGLSYDNMKLWGETSFFKNFEFATEVKLVISRLRKRGFQVEVTDVRTEHDESAAYLNSGGECGSEKIYYTNDTVMKISWKRVMSKSESKRISCQKGNKYGGQLAEENSVRGAYGR